MSKQSVVTERVKALLDKGEEIRIRALARELAPEIGSTENATKNYVTRALNKINGVVSIKPPSTDTKTEGYKEPIIFSAVHPISGKMMGIEEYCKYHNLDYSKVHSFKSVTHTGTPYYNIAFRETVIGQDIDLDAIREAIREEFSNRPRVKAPSVPSRLESPAVLKWADLHFGAHIRNLILTRDYDSAVLRKDLLTSVAQTNDFGFKTVHVHINGDLIESFSGLNHINSWMSMDPSEIGPKAVMLCTELLDEALSKVNNLGKIKIVAGNHDRTSKANDEDVKGGAAELIAWGLSLLGYEVEFHPYIITHLVEGINHINLHGDKGISKRSTKDIIWDYGEKGKFNFVFEAHLHSLIEKMSASQREKFNVIRDDSIDHRRMHLQSFFTGNYYSETLNFNSNAGYCIVWDNGRGKPHVFNGCI